MDCLVHHQIRNGYDLLVLTKYQHVVSFGCPHTLKKKHISSLFTDEETRGLEAQDNPASLPLSYATFRTSGSLRCQQMAQSLVH